MVNSSELEGRESTTFRNPDARSRLHDSHKPYMTGHSVLLPTVKYLYILSLGLVVGTPIVSRTV